MNRPDTDRGLENALIDISASSRTNATVMAITNRIEKTAKKYCSISRIR